MLAKKLMLQTVTAENRRAWILALLNDSSGFTLNERVIQTMLCELGHQSATHVIRNDMLWLKSLGLTKARIVKGVWIATLTKFGSDVAAGRADAYGVERLLPPS